MTIFLMPGQKGAPPPGQCGEAVELWLCERSRRAGENIVEGKRGGRRDNMRDTRMGRARPGPPSGLESGARFATPGSLELGRWEAGSLGTGQLVSGELGNLGAASWGAGGWGAGSWGAGSRGGGQLGK